jgi:hypothetical protein
MLLNTSDLSMVMEADLLFEAAEAAAAAAVVLFNVLIESLSGVMLRPRLLRPPAIPPPVPEPGESPIPEDKEDPVRY